MKEVIKFPKKKKRNIRKKILSIVTNPRFFFAVITALVAMTVGFAVYLNNPIKEYTEQLANRLRLEQMYGFTDQVRFPGMVESIQIKAQPANIEDIVALLRLEVENARIVGFTPADNVLMIPTCSNGKAFTDTEVCADITKPDGFITGEVLATIDVQWLDGGNAVIRSTDENGYFDSQDVYAVDIEPLVMSIDSVLPMTGVTQCSDDEKVCPGSVPEQSVCCKKSQTCKKTSSGTAYCYGTTPTPPPAGTCKTTETLCVGVLGPKCCVNNTHKCKVVYGENFCVPIKNPTPTKTEEEKCRESGRVYCYGDCCIAGQTCGYVGTSLSCKWPDVNTCKTDEIACHGICCKNSETCKMSYNEIPYCEKSGIDWDCDDSNYQGHQYKTCSNGDLYWCDNGGTVPKTQSCNGLGCETKPAGTDDVCKSSSPTNTPTVNPTGTTYPTNTPTSQPTPSPTQEPGKLACGTSGCKNDQACSGYPNYECAEKNTDDWPNQNVCAIVCPQGQTRVGNCECKKEESTKVDCGKIDVDDNGILNYIDFGEFGKMYNKECKDTAPKNGCGGKDTNGDGKINYVDFQSFASRYHTAKQSCAL